MADADDPRARDERHRGQALDPRESFLVQAPAGSGKTELLIQRYLALLSTVQEPQRIVAITFTRKAASEMRERVVAALRDAHEGTQVNTSHEATTRRLAVAALAHAKTRGWALLSNPAQLAIGTIDALSGNIARQAPLASRLGVSPRVVDDARSLHLEAARATLAAARATDSAWRRVLEHLDNDAEQVVALVASLLGKREQWLKWIVNRDPDTWRSELEALLRREIDAELAIAHSLFDASSREALARCAGYAVRHLDGADGLAIALSRCVTHGGLPPASSAEIDAWRALADWLLLKAKPQFRQGINKTGGIPPQSADGGAGRRVSDALLARLQAEAGLADALHAVRQLPSATYDDDTWATIAALLEILPQAVAELLVVFAARGTVDFAQLTLSALAALGDAQAPSDVMLRLDLAIEHLLVDEFQDTSDAQSRLLSALTAGWQAGDGRTLFAVGDPMQSIYRFRDAEVRLFLDAQKLGRIGNVPVRFLDLGRNFRSQGQIVAWVNRVFPSVLAPRNDPWRGAVAFAEAAATHPDGPEGAPTLDLVATPDEEALKVIERIRQSLEADAQDIAVLIRARRDLAAILPALRAAGIPFAAVELDSLSDRQAVVDLVSLTHALVQPADRLAALAVLRAPWCGLVLEDLLAASRELAQGLPEFLARAHEIDSLTADGHERLARIGDVLLAAFAEHGCAPIEARVRGAWLALGGPATVDQTIDLAAAEDYFALLRAHTVGGDVPDWQTFLYELDNRFATSAEAALARVKVMTLFKAKGLEFDTVIMPGLAQAHQGEDADLLKWRIRPDGLLIATMRARDGNEDAVYGYLKALAAAESDHELGRMLYVGATRAKRRLHLVATADCARDEDSEREEWKPPRSGSALAKLWDVLAHERGSPVAAATLDDNALQVSPPLCRLPAAFALPPLASVAPGVGRVREHTSAPVFEWAHATAAAVGTVSHRLLAQVAQEGLASFDDARLAHLTGRIRTELIVEGVDAGELARVVSEVTATIAAVRADARGQWLFDPAHADAVSEWALAGLDHGAIVHVTLDRSFVSEGVRWIVDFKTGRHEGAQTDAFLGREVDRYRDQLERYARIVRGLDKRPIRLALYYPLVEGGWREWPFEAPGTQASLF